MMMKFLNRKRMCPGSVTAGETALKENDMSDYINRQAAIDAIDTWDKFGCAADGRLVRLDDEKDYVPYIHYEDVVRAINSLPSADVQPVRHGWWIKGVSENGVTTSLFCSECNAENSHYYDWNFCPNCGARMDGDT